MAATNGGDVLFVAYMDDLGKLFIERWTFHIDDGRWIHTAPSIPTPQYSGVTQIKGGVFAAPTSENHVTPRRKTIFRGGTDIAELRAMEADPEGRFLLLYENTRILWKLPISAGTSGPAAVLYDQTSAPELTIVRDIQAHDHTLGRVYVCTEMRSDSELNAQTHVLLVDNENDGVFDSKLDVSYADWTESSTYGIGSWTPIFRAGTDV